jgi:hypothetical protein
MGREGMMQKRITISRELLMATAEVLAHDDYLLDQEYGGPDLTKRGRFHDTGGAPCPSCSVRQAIEEILAQHGVQVRHDGALTEWRV